MLKTIFTSLMLCISLVTFAQINIPALSPSVKITQKIGLTTAELSYSRPSLYGRSLFGDQGILVQGKKWRTGANATTKLTFSNDVELNGRVLAKGSYALLSTPQQNSWTFHFYPYEKGTYTQFLNRVPLLEITVPIEKTNDQVETLSIQFEEIQLQAAQLVFQWADYKMAIPIQLDEHESILANIERELKGPSNFDYFQAALYLHETQTNLPLALTYIRKATKSDQAQFFQVYREALILRDLNRNTEAVEVAKRSVELSKKAGNNDLARLSQRIIDDLSN